MARKRKVDPEQLEKLAAIDCSYEEMASILNVGVSTLTQKHYRHAIEAGRARGTSSLKRKQFEVAMMGNVRMLTHLGKTRLGQKETIQVDNLNPTQINTNVTNVISDEAIKAALERLKDEI